MKKRLVIFDLDGTLLNTIADLAVATNEALRAMGYPTHAEEVIQTFVGNGVSKLLERSMPLDKRTEENIALVRRHFMAYYDQHNADLSTPYPGIADMLSRLQEDGVMLAVASNKYQSATEKLIARYFPHINFVCVLGQRQGIPVKPSPDIVLEIMEKANVSRSDTLYVGDSGVDMQTAINAGIDAIAVSWGFRPRAELQSFSPLGIIDSAEELLRYVV